MEFYGGALEIDRLAGGDGFGVARIVDSDQPSDSVAVFVGERIVRGSRLVSEPRTLGLDAYTVSGKSLSPFGRLAIAIPLTKVVVRQGIRGIG